MDNKNLTIIDDSFDNGIQPEKIILTMKCHQLKVFKYCLSLEKKEIEQTIYIKEDNDTKEKKVKIRSNIGIIGNSVGSGKSLIIMALMATENNIKI